MTVRLKNRTLRPLLTQNLSSRILYGYGDPAVVRVDGASGARWWLYVTSNDAPDAFPILSSADLVEWRHEGFVFPEGAAPAWTAAGAGVADFWAPELHRVGDAWWLCFTARRRNGELAIGIARATRPEGPFEGDPAPLVTGGVIDAHLVQTPAGDPYLVWKEDHNDRWPRLVGDLLVREETAAEQLFGGVVAGRAAVACALRFAAIGPAGPMDDFLRLQPLIELAAADFPAFRRALRTLADEPGRDDGLRRLAAQALDAARTRILAQRITPDGRSLSGSPTAILENDLPWEAHLVEGPWISRLGNRYALFYAGNDFATEHYGIGVALADHALGPYAKQPEPLLRSTATWVGPGHPSVALDADGTPRMFLHAFRPAEVGYKAFRALLTVRLEVVDQEA